MTAAGATTLGLACGLAQPALGEWWKLAQPEKASQTAAKPAPVANGFEGTIRRLLAESQYAAEQGDHRKAVQLAERAAKISEAAAQVVGPAGACSPQETTRFLAEMRTRNSAPAAVASQSSFAPVAAAQRAVEPVPQLVPTQTVAAAAMSLENSAQARLDSLPRTPVANSMSTSAPADITASESPEPVIAQRSKVAASPVSRTSSVTNQEPESSLASNEQTSDGPGLFGTPQLPPPGSRSFESHARVDDGPTTRKSRGSADEAASPRNHVSRRWIAVGEDTMTDELLVKSRQAAAEGHLDRAIDLAEQAIASTPTPSLFGPSEPSSGSGEALRWRDHLTARKDAQPKSDAVVFERPVKVAVRQKRPATAPIATATKVALPSSTPLAGRQMPDSARTSISDSTPVGTGTDVSSVADHSRSIAPAQSVMTASKTDEHPFWSEDLPPAPAPQPRTGASPIKFSRSVISRSGVWVNADSIETEPEFKDSRASAESVPSTNPVDASAVLEESDATIPEFPIRAASEPGIPMSSPQVMAATEAGFSRKDRGTAPFAIRGTGVRTANPSEPVHQDRHVNQIQQVAAQVPETERSATPGSSRPSLTSARNNAKALPRDDEWIQKPPASSDASRAIDANEADDSVKAVQSDESPAAGNTPTERFPVQRVLRLRQRLSSAASSEAGVWTSAKSATNQDGTWQSIPFDEEAESSPHVEADARTSDSASTDARSSASPSVKSPSAESPVESAVIGQKRPPLKLRERSRPQLDSQSSHEPNSSTMAPKPAGQPRMPVVAHSELSQWKSADTLEVPIHMPAIAGSDSQLPSEPSAQRSYSFSETTQNHAIQPGLVPPIAQVGFESTESLPGGNGVSATAGQDPSQPDSASSAPPPPTLDEESPWYRDETRQQSTSSSADIVVHKSSFATIDRMAEALSVPVSTMTSLIGGAGLALVICGLLCLRTAVRKRHSD
jgi:hypothetical protein